MTKFLLWTGRAGGVVGVLLCTVAVIVRLGGAYTLGRFQVVTLLLGGMAAMLVGCLGYLASLAERERG